MTLSLTAAITLTVREHDTVLRGEFTCDGPAPTLAAAAFDAVLALVSEPELAAVAMPILVQGQPALKLQQWVGVIRTPDGTTLEILPKTHQSGDDPQASRALLLRMLSVTDERFKVAPPADLDPAHMPLFEVVLRYALEGFRAAIRRGVPHAYVAVQEERSGLRGRLNMTRQVRQLPQRAHLLQVEYDEFLPDRPETRLVRRSVERIARLTRRDGTRRLARELLFALDEVPPSREINRDFAAWRLERGYTHFAPLESLCRLVLHELNPLAGGGTSRALGVLFNMNRVFESYVALLLRRQYPEWTVRTQVIGKALGRVGISPPSLRPDLLLATPSGEVIVADTKWKRLSPEEAPTYGVSNADAYQMLAYSEVFQHEQPNPQIWLIYPRVAGLPVELPPITLTGQRTLHTLALDLHWDAAEWPRVSTWAAKTE